MRYNFRVVCVFFFLFASSILFCQVQLSETLFQSQSPLPLQLAYTNKQVKKETNKKEGIHTNLIYKVDKEWDTIPISLRARGNFRRANCFFTPIKIYLKRGGTQNTPFTGHKNLKVVLPCLLEDRSNDDVLKEYLAYKMYEVLAPLHFKTRLATMQYTDTRSEKDELHPLAAFLSKPNFLDYNGEEAMAARKPKKYTLNAILIEDDKVVAKRHNANVLKRFVHPLNQEEALSMTNAFFQFMIGNTDFSTAYQHNQKLIFTEGKACPIPYDFDMSGLVDASYAVVSNIQNNPLNISKVTQRQYRGFKRPRESLQNTRNHFLDRETAIMDVLKAHRPLFKEVKSYQNAHAYITSFFDILKDANRFNVEIVATARLK
jgi:hypothetical protein